MNVLGLLLVPLIVAGLGLVLLRYTITIKEAAVQFGAAALIVLCGYGIASCQAIEDTQHLNGRLTAKIKRERSCCHCHQECISRDSKGNCTVSHEVCDHSRDWQWWLDTTVGSIDIETCKHSSSDPQRWTEAVIGEPVSIESSYDNYLKADPDSLLRHNDKRFVSSVPNYPEVYDLYRKHSVISNGVEIPREWERYVRDIGADFGASLQVDVTVLLTNVQDPVYVQSVESKWLYGPKNSLTLVLGVDKERKVSWVGVVTISKVEELKVRLREDIKGKSIDSIEIVGILRENVRKYFKRTSMSEFEYLANNWQPSTGVLVFLYILGLVVSVGLGIYFHQEDVFGEQGNYKWNQSNFVRDWLRHRGYFS